MPLVESFSQQRWIPYRVRRSVLKRLAPDFLTQQRDAVFVDGLRFRCNLVDYIERLIYFCGAHEKFMLAFLRDAAAQIENATNAPVSYVDVGANVGNHAIYMASRVAKVHAFEPFPRVRDRLDANIELNKLDNIVVHPVGLGEKDAEMPFFAPPDANQGAGSFMEGFPEYNTAYGTLQIVQGDAYFAEHNIGKFQILKADIEGFERYALLGLREEVRASRPLMVIELLEKSRANYGDAAGFRATFPEDYQFFMFKVADLERGRYVLAPFDYDAPMQGQDVVCCPKEWAELLPKSGKF